MTKQEQKDWRTDVRERLEDLLGGFCQEIALEASAENAHPDDVEGLGFELMEALYGKVEPLADSIVDALAEQKTEVVL